MENTKQERLLEIFFRDLRGEGLSVQKLADEYEVCTKSIGRNISDLKTFLAEHRELVGNTELKYSNQDKNYHLDMDEFLTAAELFALTEVIIGARAFSREELLTLTGDTGGKRVLKRHLEDVFFYEVKKEEVKDWDYNEDSAGYTVRE